MKLFIVTDTDGMPIAVFDTHAQAKALADAYEAKRQTAYHGYYTIRELELNVTPSVDDL